MSQNKNKRILINKYSKKSMQAGYRTTKAKIQSKKDVKGQF